MSEIKTLVYFDIEATGLKSSGRPRITEISFVAVDIQEIFSLNQKLLEKVKNIKSQKDILELELLLPRVLNKLTLCLCPMAPIMPEVSRITGLDNYNLTGQAIFDKSTGDFLKAFLSRQPFPVCLVAHNGNMYDFPLLKAELLKAGSALESNIFCVDSYVGIKNIFKKNLESPLAKNAQHASIKCLDERKLVEKEKQAVKLLLEAGEFDEEMEIDKNKSNRTSDSLVNENSGIFFNFNMLIDKNKSELTPLKNSNPLNINPHSRMTKIVQRKKMQSSEYSKSKKKIEFSTYEYPKSFSLENLHIHLLGYPPVVSHGAEADCLALLRITAVLGEKWLDWVNNNCSLFSNTERMWGK